MTLPPPKPPAIAGVSGGALRWVPIRALAPRHRPRILAHLLALGPDDRHLRFGYTASDSQIGRYIDQIDFERDAVFGIFNRRLQVVAMAHLACLGTSDLAPSAAEFGVSVAPHARGRGWGTRLFDRAVLQARNRHIDTLLIHALAENKAMLHIVREAGAQVVYEGPDAVARLQLPPEDMASHWVAMVERQAAEFDYGLKLQVRRVDAWWHLLGDLPAAQSPPPPGTRDTEPGAAPP
jgi:GNAT superfamily N-acetyltransferase